MNRILVKPSKSWFGGRRQWKFELRAANGERIDPRDTYANRDEAADAITNFLTGPLEVVLYDRHNAVQTRKSMR